MWSHVRRPGPCTFVARECNSLAHIQYLGQEISQGHSANESFWELWSSVASFTLNMVYATAPCMPLSSPTFTSAPIRTQNHAYQSSNESDSTAFNNTRWILGTRQSDTSWCVCLLCFGGLQRQYVRTTTPSMSFRRDFSECQRSSWAASSSSFRGSPCHSH